VSGEKNIVQKVHRGLCGDLILAKHKEHNFLHRFLTQDLKF